MKTLGLIGGMSWQSSVLYYQRLNELAAERLGGLHSAKLLLWSFDFSEIEALQAAADWDGATAKMLDAAGKLKAGGADILVICANTMHRMADTVAEETGLPLLHIVDATAQHIKASLVRRPLLLGTRFTMEQEFYAGRFGSKHKIDVVVPNAADRQIVHDVIYQELCVGDIQPRSKAAYLNIIETARAEAGIDGVIMGCTEIPMLLSEDDIDLPTFDTTEIHVAAAMDAAMAG